ncbi:hypothetical protein AMST5_03874 [freshwater sediment metagenome]|uniref:Glycosyltransferase 2-like domain-containing protein n=1 Tax=freshwater sediment metagenome TaxID=556182 RepID=A0AA48M2S9_9ZZZZ
MTVGSDRDHANGLVSVVIPCYAQARFLADCIASLRAQTYPFWEAIIINDGSPDNTEEVARSLMASDPRIRLLCKPNGGLPSARNAGIEVAKGAYIQFLDADDAIHPDKFAVQCQALDSLTAARLAFSDFAVARDDIANIEVLHQKTTYDGNLSIYELCADWETRIIMPPHCILYSRELIDKGLRFDESLPTHEDWDFLVGAFLECKSVVHTPGPFAIYRRHSSNMSSKHAAMRAGYIAAIDKRLNQRIDVPGLHALLRAKKAETIASYVRPNAIRSAVSRGRGLVGRVKKRIERLG